MSLHRSDIQGESNFKCPKCQSDMSQEYYVEAFTGEANSYYWKECINPECKHKIYDEEE